MKKRKELNALVANGKARCAIKKLAAAATGGGSSSAAGDGCCPSSQELLHNDGSDTTDTEEMSVLRARKSLNGRTASRVCVACMPVCMLTLMTACVVGSAMLIWMHLALREEVDMLRNYFRKVESGTRKTPEEFHIVHSQLNLLDGNNTANQESIAKITDTLTSLNKDIESLRKKTDSLSKSIAAEPQITMLPQTVESLQGSVATLGSKITNMDSMAKELKDQTNNLNKQLQAEIDSLRKKVDALSNDSRVQAVTAVTPSMQTVEELQHLGILFEELNKSMTIALEDLQHVKIEPLQNSTKRLETRVNSLEKKVDVLDNIPEKLNEIVQEKVNQSLDAYVHSGGDGLVANNATKKQLLDYLGNLTVVYQTLLTNFSQHKAEEEDLIHSVINASASSAVEHYLSEKLESMQKKQADQIKVIENEIVKLNQYIEEMKKTSVTNQGITSYPADKETTSPGFDELTATTTAKQQFFSTESSLLDSRRKLQRLQFTP